MSFMKVKFHQIDYHWDFFNAKPKSLLPLFVLHCEMQVSNFKLSN